MAGALEHLTDQIFGQLHVVARHVEQRDDVVMGDRPEQVGQRAVLEEFAGEAGIGAEQQGGLAADDASVEMGHRHGRRAGGGLAIDFGMVAPGHRVVVAAQPDAADREAAIAAPLRNAGSLEQLERGAAGADEDEAGRDGLAGTAIGILDGDLPAPAGLPVERHDLAVVVEVEARLAREGRDQEMGERAVVDVAAGDHARGGDRLTRIASFDDERCPFGDLGPILAVFHPHVAMMRRHLPIAGPKEGDVLRRPRRSSYVGRGG